MNSLDIEKEVPVNYGELNLPKGKIGTKLQLSAEVRKAEALLNHGSLSTALLNNRFQRTGAPIWAAASLGYCWQGRGLSECPVHPERLRRGVG